MTDLGPHPPVPIPRSLDKLEELYDWADDNRVWIDPTR